MQESKLPSPHNRFFHYSFSNMEVARNFLESQLEPQVLNCIDLETIKIVPGSFVDDQLRESQSDLLFSVATKKALLASPSGDSKPNSVLIYVLMEHKSHPDPLTSFQMLKYIVRILEQLLREGQPLACVVPLIVYHGESRWNVAKSLDDLLAAPEALKRHMPQFAPLLLDLGRLPEEQKFPNPFLQVVVQTLRWIWGEQIRTHLVELVDSFREITHDGRDADPLKAFLVYLISAAPKLDRRELMEAVKQSFPNQGPALMSTIAEQYFLEGRQEGRQEGIEEGVQKGELIGVIRTCQSILKQMELSETELRSKPLEELTAMAKELTGLLRSRVNVN
ncbi:MAG: Rpn family recombination-promoting nuclease/putative transposase [Planctomycetota bacterium]|nr:Rpn family recombination-promoting nuclease/putative transposase [Planctomycetota bacterium]